MLGYKLPEKLVQPQEIRKAYEGLRGEDMTLEFNIAPKTEEDQEKLRWFEQSCPNQFIADCIRRVVRRSQALAQEAYVNEKDPDRFMYLVIEATRITKVYHAWRDLPDVQEVLKIEKKRLELQAGEHWGIDIPKERKNQPNIIEPPAEQKESSRPSDAPDEGRKPAKALLREMRPAMYTVGQANLGSPCPFCPTEQPAGGDHHADCLIVKFKGWHKKTEEVLKEGE